MSAELLWHLGVHSIGVALAGAIAFGLTRVGRRDPDHAYRLLRGLVLAVLVLPALQIAVEGRAGLRLRALGARLVPGTASPTAEVVAEPAPALLGSDELALLVLAESWPAALAADPAAEAVAPIEPTPSAEPTGFLAGFLARGRHTVTRVLPLLWLAGVLGMLAFQLLRVLRTRRTLSACEPVTDADAIALWRKVAAGSRFRDRARLLFGRDLHSPGCFGLGRRPAVLIPSRALEPQHRQALECALMHELVHLERGDSWAALGEAAARTLFWFHPAIWWLSRELDRLRESTCDLQVVRRTGRPRSYALALLGYALGEVPAEPAAAPTLLHWTHSPSQLRRRIEMLANRGRTPSRLARWSRWGLSAGFLGAVWSGQLATAALFDGGGDQENEDAVLAEIVAWLDEEDAADGTALVETHVVVTPGDGEHAGDGEHRRVARIEIVGPNGEREVVELEVPMLVEGEKALIEIVAPESGATAIVEVRGDDEDAQQSERRFVVRGLPGHEGGEHVFFGKGDGEGEALFFSDDEHDFDFEFDDENENVFFGHGGDGDGHGNVFFHGGDGGENVHVIDLFGDGEGHGAGHFDPAENVFAVGGDHRLGVHVTSAEGALAAHLGLDAGEGLLVTEVDENSAAARAGFEAHDVIVGLPGGRPATVEALQAAVRKSGSELELRVLRRGKPLKLVARFGGGKARFGVAGQALPGPKSGSVWFGSGADDETHRRYRIVTPQGQHDVEIERDGEGVWIEEDGTGRHQRYRVVVPDGGEWFSADGPNARLPKSKAPNQRYRIVVPDGGEWFSADGPNARLPKSKAPKVKLPKVKMKGDLRIELAPEIDGDALLRVAPNVLILGGDDLDVEQLHELLQSHGELPKIHVETIRGSLENLREHHEELLRRSEHGEHSERAVEAYEKALAGLHGHVGGIDLTRFDGGEHAEDLEKALAHLHERAGDLKLDLTKLHEHGQHLKLGAHSPEDLKAALAGLHAHADELKIELAELHEHGQQLKHEAHAAEDMTKAGADLRLRIESLGRLGELGRLAEIGELKDFTGIVERLHGAQGDHEAIEIPGSGTWIIESRDGAVRLRRVDGTEGEELQHHRDDHDSDHRGHDGADRDSETSRTSKTERTVL